MFSIKINSYVNFRRPSFPLPITSRENITYPGIKIYLTKGNFVILVVGHVEIYKKNWACFMHDFWDTNDQTNSSLHSLQHRKNQLRQGKTI